ncbi:MULTISPECIES: hypothetical protein [unclassified Nonomuraea]|uniref:hypothetical protein n=1 Tax=unclassified Nonomuraea TaxID=2593643 RepID=UPI00340CF70C
MSRIKRGLAFAAVALTLTAGPALLASAPATAATATTTATAEAALGRYVFAGRYASYDNGYERCHLDGQRSARAYQCLSKYYENEGFFWTLWLWTA